MTRNLVMAWVALLLAGAPAQGAERVCAKAFVIPPDQIDAQLVREHGTVLWYLEQNERSCNGGTCGAWQEPGRYLELVTTDDRGGMWRYPFTEVHDRYAHLRIRRDRGGLLEFFRPVIVGASEATDRPAGPDQRIGRLGKKLLHHYVYGDAAAGQQYRMGIWNVKLHSDARFEVASDFSYACLSF